MQKQGRPSEKSNRYERQLAIAHFFLLNPKELSIVKILVSSTSHSL